MQDATQPKLRTARIMAAGITAGPLLFWIVVWTMLGQNGTLAPELPLAPPLAAWIWVGVALPCFGAGLVFRQKALSLVETSHRVTDATAAEKVLGEVQTNLVVAWALFEGPALLSGVFYFLFAVADFVWGGAAVLGIGMYMSFPRREWYAPFQRISDRGATVAD